MRHAEATQVKISLRATRRSVILRVIDNGRGIKPEELKHPGSLGLLGMRERARLWGGKLFIKGDGGKGTEVKVIFPIEGPKLPESQ